MVYIQKIYCSIEFVMELDITKVKKTDQRSDINLIKDIGELYDELNENK